MKNFAPKHELIELKTTIQRQKNTKPASPYYLTSAQRKYLIQSQRIVAYVVFAFYVEKATNAGGYDYSDSRVAPVLGLTERQVKEARRCLIKLGWFYRSAFKDKRGVKVIITYLGVEAVNAYKHSLSVAKITQIKAETYE